MLHPQHRKCEQGKKSMNETGSLVVTTRSLLECAVICEQYTDCHTFNFSHRDSICEVIKGYNDGQYVSDENYIFCGLAY